MAEGAAVLRRNRPGTKAKVGFSSGGPTQTPHDGLRYLRTAMQFLPASFHRQLGPRHRLKGACHRNAQLAVVSFLHRLIAGMKGSLK